MLSTIQSIKKQCCKCNTLEEGAPSNCDLFYSRLRIFVSYKIAKLHFQYLGGDGCPILQPAQGLHIKFTFKLYDSTVISNYNAIL